MTKREAKRRSLKVWKYLAAHPEIGKKEDLPSELWMLIKDDISLCPLCSLFLKHDCIGCPINNNWTNCCYSYSSAFKGWIENRNRAENAQKIVDLIKEWPVK